MWKFARIMLWFYGHDTLIVWVYETMTMCENNTTFGLVLRFSLLFCALFVLCVSENFLFFRYLKAAFAYWPPSCFSLLASSSHLSFLILTAHAFARKTPAPEDQRTTEAQVLEILSSGCKYFVFKGTWIFPGCVNLFSFIIPPLFSCPHPVSPHCCLQPHLASCDRLVITPAASPDKQFRARNHLETWEFYSATICPGILAIQDTTLRRTSLTPQVQQLLPYNATVRFAGTRPNFELL